MVHVLSQHSEGRRRRVGGLIYIASSRTTRATQRSPKTTTTSKQTNPPKNQNKNKNEGKSLGKHNGSQDKGGGYQACDLIVIPDKQMVGRENLLLNVAL